MNPSAAPTDGWLSSTSQLVSHLRRLASLQLELFGETWRDSSKSLRSGVLMLGLGIALFSSAVPGLLFSAALALHLYADFNLLQAAFAVSAGALIIGGMLIGLSARRLSSARSQLTAPLKELRLNLGALSGADE